MLLIVPISDDSTFFPRQDYYFPKPLIDISGKVLIRRVCESLLRSFPCATFLFIIPESIEKEFALSSILKLDLHGAVKAEFFIRKDNTSGAFCSVLSASDHIPSGHILIVNSDIIFDSDLKDAIPHFTSTCSDVGLLSHESTHPYWAYLSRDSSNTVSSVHEKSVVSREAISGFYYFRSGELFLKYAAKVLLSDDSYNNNYYLSSVVNQYILDDLNVSVYSISSLAVTSLHTPAGVANYKNKLQESNHRLNQPTVPNLVIPAAGKGSRFVQASFDTPKPFIDVDGVPMLTRVAANLDSSSFNTVLIGQNSHSNYWKSIEKSVYPGHIHLLDGFTEGTLCTVLSARHLLDPQCPLIIANSDQLVDFCIHDFLSTMHRSNLDGLILCFEASDMSTKWSYVATNDEGHVTQVAEKQPISTLATVGIYAFKDTATFVDAAFSMIVRNERTNNEFYVAPVYNEYVARGLRVGTYTIPAKCMHGLGTPDDLQSYLEQLVS